MVLTITTTQAAEAGLHPVIYALSWMLLSSAMTILNKYLLDVAHFPTTLTFLHLATITVSTQFLARYTPLITRPSAPITGRLYLRTILPIGLLYTLSLICANNAYTALPLPTTQILKASAPLATICISWAVAFTNPLNMSGPLRMALIAVGVCVTSLGSELSLPGQDIWLCLLGTGAECGRLLVVEKLLKEPRRGRFPGAGTPVLLDEELGRESAATDAASGMAMSPLVALYYFAPVCAFLSGSMAFAFEIRTLRVVELQRVGISVLVLSCALAFMLNVAGVFLISKTSALTMSLLGIVKLPIPIAASILMWNTPVSFAQIMGYGWALGVTINHSLSPEALGPHVNAWFDRTMSSVSWPSFCDSVLEKVTACLGSVITITPKESHQEARRGRTGQREDTPRSSPEKAGPSLDSVSKETPNGKGAGRLD